MSVPPPTPARPVRANRKQPDYNEEKEGEEELLPFPSAPSSGSSTTPEPMRQDSGEQSGDPGPRSRKAKENAKKRLVHAEKLERAEDDTEDLTSSEDEGHEDSEEHEEICVNGIHWLHVGDPFPWTETAFYLDPSLGKTMSAHVTKRIKKSGGRVILHPSSASVILINPHPPRITKDRIALLSSIERVKTCETPIISYHWLSRCYFSKKVERGVKGLPVFVDSTAECEKIAVGRFEGHGGDHLRTRIMQAVENNGGIVVDVSQASICILPKSHPFHTSPPEGNEPKYQDIVFKTPDWLFAVVEAADQKEKAARIKETKVRRKAHSNAKVKKNVVKEVKHKTRSTTRTKFSPHDREMLARWLAYKRPSEVGRTTRSLYKQLENYEPTHRFFKWASRHTASAWHEHYKRSGSKRGTDGRVLSEEIERYVALGVDESLKTRDERLGQGRSYERAAEHEDEHNNVQIRQKDQNRDKGRRIKRNLEGEEPQMARKRPTKRHPRDEVEQNLTLRSGRQPKTGSTTGNSSAHGMSRTMRPDAEITSSDSRSERSTSDSDVGEHASESDDNVENEEEDEDEVERNEIIDHGESVGGYSQLESLKQTQNTNVSGRFNDASNEGAGKRAKVGVEVKGVHQKAKVRFISEDVDEDEDDEHEDDHGGVNEEDDGSEAESGKEGESAVDGGVVESSSRADSEEVDDAVGGAPDGAAVPPNEVEGEDGPSDTQTRLRPQKGRMKR